MVYLIGPLISGTEQSFSCIFLFRSADPPQLGKGSDLSFWLIRLCTGLCDFLLSIFGGVISPRPPLEGFHYSGFSRFLQHILAPIPLAGDMAAIVVDSFPAPYG